MAKCFMCGAAIANGILCEKCDKPRRKAAEPVTAEPKAAAPAPPPAPAAKKAMPPPESVPAPRAKATPPLPGGPPSQPPQRGIPAIKAALAPEVEPEPFPKAPVVQFPVEAASPALTSIASILIAAGVPSVLVGPDGSVKFMSDEARHLFDTTQADLRNVRAIEERTGLRIGELSVPASGGLQIRKTSVLYSLVPLSGGAGGAVLIFRYADADHARAPFVTYVRETVLGPLRGLRDSLLAAARSRSGGDPILADSAFTLDQVLSSLELAPEVGDPTPSPPAVPTATAVVHRVADRFRPFADLKGIQMQVDAPELDECFRDSEQLAEALGILMDNALHYVPAGGQVVIGVRWMEHKSKPLLLFFVMDNGPIVPESLRQVMLEPNFVWNPQSTERTGRSLFRAREFAVAHSGSIWVESKTGKACTFFLRVRPDGRGS